MSPMEEKEENAESEEMSQCLSIPGIMNVYYLRSAYLSCDVTFRAEAGVPVKTQQQPIIVQLKGEAVCEVESQFDNNSQLEKAKLTFITLDDVPLYYHLAFVIQTVQGEYFVIGAREQPYPTVKVTRTTGSPDGDAAARKYEVSFTARKALAALSV